MGGANAILRIRGRARSLELRDVELPTVQDVNVQRFMPSAGFLGTIGGGMHLLSWSGRFPLGGFFAGKRDVVMHGSRGEVVKVTDGGPSRRADSSAMPVSTAPFVPRLAVKGSMTLNGLFKGLVGAFTALRKWHIFGDMLSMVEKVESGVDKDALELVRLSRISDDGRTYDDAERLGSKMSSVASKAILAVNPFAFVGRDMTDGVVSLLVRQEELGGVWVRALHRKMASTSLAKLAEQGSLSAMDELVRRWRELKESEAALVIRTIDGTGIARRMMELKRSADDQSLRPSVRRGYNVKAVRMYKYLTMLAGYNQASAKVRDGIRLQDVPRAPFEVWARSEEVK